MFRGKPAVMATAVYDNTAQAREYVNQREVKIGQTGQRPAPAGANRLMSRQDAGRLTGDRHHERRGESEVLGIAGQDAIHIQDTRTVIR
jgi:hypothetical protein